MEEKYPTRWSLATNMVKNDLVIESVGCGVLWGFM
jgi:hypothetical protein